MQPSDRQGGQRPDCPNPSPIQPREQRLKLGAAEVHHPILDRWPSKCVFLQPHIGHDQTRAVPLQRLQPIPPAGPEHKYGASKWILAHLILHRRCQPIMTLAQVDRLGRHHDPRPASRRMVSPGRSQAACSAAASSAIRTGGVAASSRRVMPPAINSLRS